MHRPSRMCPYLCCRCGGVFDPEEVVVREMVEDFEPYERSEP